MIYPSHWNPGDFGIEHPDLEPYKTVDNYLDKEEAVLKKLESSILKRVLGCKISLQAI